MLACQQIFRGVALHYGKYLSVITKIESGKMIIEVRIGFDRRIFLVGVFMGSYRVRKESGITGRKPDRRAWSYDTFEDAEKEFDRKLKSKTNPFRKSPRKYAVAGNAPQIEKSQDWRKTDALRGPIRGHQGIAHILEWVFRRFRNR